MAYANFAIGTVLGLCFVLFGAITIIDECKFVKKIKGINVMIKIYFHLAIASGVVYLILGVILIFLYVAVSKTLVKGIKAVRFYYS